MALECVSDMHGIIMWWGGVYVNSIEGRVWVVFPRLSAIAKILLRVPL